MPSYKITYFNGRGRAELSRLLFAVTETKYEDERLTFEEWPKRKADTPLGQLPVFYIDGKAYPQSIAFARYLAEKSNLAGKDDMEKLQANVVVETIGDLITAMYKFMFGDDEAVKAANKKTALEVTAPQILGYLEKWLETIGNNSGYFLKSGFSWADLCVFDFLEKWVPFDPSFKAGKYPKLEAHSKRIGGQPNVAAWLKKRPETPF